VTGINNIVYFNTATTDPEISGILNFDYSCCSTALTGTDNITDDPSFIDRANYNLHLNATSPCIDTGDPNSPQDPDGTRADMGALYFDQSAPDISVSATNLDFPSMIVGSNTTLPLTIYNIGNADLIVSDISLTLINIFSHNWNINDTLVIPGDSIVLEVTFSPTDTLDYNDTLRITNNDSALSVSMEGTGLPEDGVSSSGEFNPRSFALYEARPNPFNCETIISFRTPADGNVSLTVYDITGVEITCLMKGWMQTGAHQIKFDASALPSGIYFVKLVAGERYSAVKKVVLLK
jgi:hypothetical protein